MLRKNEYIKSTFRWESKVKGQLLNVQQENKELLESIMRPDDLFCLNVYQHYQSYGYVSSKEIILIFLRCTGT